MFTTQFNGHRLLIWDYTQLQEGPLCPLLRVIKGSLIIKPEIDSSSFVHKGNVESGETSFTTAKNLENSKIRMRLQAPYGLSRPPRNYPEATLQQRNLPPPNGQSLKVAALATRLS